MLSSLSSNSLSERLSSGSSPRTCVASKRPTLGVISCVDFFSSSAARLLPLFGDFRGEGWERAGTPPSVPSKLVLAAGDADPFFTLLAFAFLATPGFFLPPRRMFEPGVGLPARFSETDARCVCRSFGERLPFCFWARANPVFLSGEALDRPARRFPCLGTALAAFFAALAVPFGTAPAEAARRSRS